MKQKAHLWAISNHQTKPSKGTKMQTKKQTNKALVRNIDKLNCTVNGNPRYHVVLHNLDNNEVMCGNTASDHQFVYCMPTLGSIVSVKWHKTKKGNIIFDDMETINKGIVE